MPIIQRLVSHDEMFRNSKLEPVIINDFVKSTHEEMEKILEMIYSKYSTDMVSVMPSCSCGETTGEYSVEQGDVCPKCLSKVENKLKDDVDPVLWMRCPQGVSALINPEAWLVMSQVFMRVSFNTIQYIADTTYRPPTKPPVKLLEELEQAGIGRGYNYFVDNFDEIMEKLMSLKIFRQKRVDIAALRKFIKMNRNIIFSRYVPFQNKALLVIEKTSVGTYIDPNIGILANAINLLIGLDTEDLKQRQRENSVAKAISTLAIYYNSHFKDSFCGKPGQLRKNMFGTRSHFSFRTVISSITVPHKYNEIHIPWSVGVTMMSMHILNKLLRRGYTLNNAYKLINEHVNVYNKELDDIMKGLIAASPYGGIVGIFNRFPSLLAGSLQCLIVTQVKTSVNDNTTSLSDSILVAFNADGMLLTQLILKDLG